MSGYIPKIQELYDRIKANLLSNANIQLSQDLTLTAIATFIAMDSADARLTFDNAIKQMFPRLATEEQFIVNNAFIWTNNTIQRKNGSFATGSLIVTATQQVDIPIGTQFSTVDGIVYKSKTLRSCIDQPFNIESLVRTNNEAIVKITNHNLANGMDFEIIGANESAFNGKQTITIIDKDYFKYSNTGSDETATGTITGQYFGVLVEVESVEATNDANKDFANTISIDDFIDYVENVYISYNGIIGGSDIETLESLKARTVEFLENPTNAGNRYQHQSWLKQNTNANYAYVFQDEDSFYNYVYCVISQIDETTLNFTNFSTQELDKIKADFLNDNQLPLGCSGNKTVVQNPSFVNINITINGLLPNTLAMQNQVKLELKRYINPLPVKKYLSNDFSELSNSKIQNIIINTRDTNGQSPSFTGMFIGGTGSLTTNVSKPILGTVVFG